MRLTPEITWGLFVTASTITSIPWWWWVVVIAMACCCCCAPRPRRGYTYIPDVESQINGANGEWTGSDDIAMKPCEDFRCTRRHYHRKRAHPAARRIAQAQPEPREPRVPKFYACPEPLTCQIVGHWHAHRDNGGPRPAGTVDCEIVDADDARDRGALQNARDAAYYCRGCQDLECLDCNLANRVEARQDGGEALMPDLQMEGVEQPPGAYHVRGGNPNLPGLGHLVRIQPPLNDQPILEAVERGGLVQMVEAEVEMAAEVVPVAQPVDQQPVEGGPPPQPPAENGDPLQPPVVHQQPPPPRHQEYDAPPPPPPGDPPGLDDQEADTTAFTDVSEAAEEPIVIRLYVREVLPDGSPDSFTEWVASFVHSILRATTIESSEIEFAGNVDTFALSQEHRRDTRHRYVWWLRLFGIRGYTTNTVTNLQMVRANWNSYYDVSVYPHLAEALITAHFSTNTYGSDCNSLAYVANRLFEEVRTNHPVYTRADHAVVTHTVMHVINIFQIRQMVVTGTLHLFSRNSLTNHGRSTLHFR